MWGMYTHGTCKITEVSSMKEVNYAMFHALVCSHHKIIFRCFAKELQNLKGFKTNPELAFFLLDK